MNYSRGEIWLVNLDPSVGNEIKKTRPAIIISSDSFGNELSLKLIVPITEWKSNFENLPNSLIKIKLIPDDFNKLDKTSTADCLQMRSIDTKRLIKKIGSVDSDTLEQISAAIAILVEYK